MITPYARELVPGSFWIRYNKIFFVVANMNGPQLAEKMTYKLIMLSPTGGPWTVAS